QTGLLHARLSPVPTAAGVLTLSSAAPQIAQVPVGVPYAAGQASVAVPVRGEQAGLAQIRVSLSHEGTGVSSALSASVQVTALAPRLQGFEPATLSVRPNT